MAISKSAAKPAKKAATPAKPAKAPAAKSGKTSAVKAPAAKAAVAPKKTAAVKAPKAVHPEQRRNYIEVAAYFIAERHGFTPGRELADWEAAEAEIDRLLAAGLLNPPA